MPVVTTSAACTLALLTAGGSPIASRKVLQLTPYAIPRLPSIICPRKPTRMHARNKVVPSIAPLPSPVRSLRAAFILSLLFNEHTDCEIILTCIKFLYILFI